MMKTVIFIERNTYNGYKIPNEIKDKVTIWE